MNEPIQTREILSYLSKVLFIMIVIVLTVKAGSDLKKARFEQIKLEYIESGDWAESAHALGVHPDSLTWEMFIEHNSLRTVRDVRQYMEDLDSAE